MKRIPLVALALSLVGAVLFSAGCANVQQAAPANRPLTYALVATVNGSQPPTDAQWAALLKRFEPMLAARGVKLLVDPSLADKLIQVQFYPDADDPTMGTIYVVGISTNPGATLVASTTPARTSTSYASNTYHSSSLYPQYYGYFNNYDPDYGYNSSTYIGGSTTVSKPNTTPPTHTTRPVVCPPDSGHSNSGTYAGHRPGEGSRQRPYPDSNGSYSSGGSSSGSSSSGSSYSSSSGSSGSSYSSSSGSSYSSSGSSSSSYSSSSGSSYSGSSSYSAPSYSPPSYESSSSSKNDGGSQHQPR